MTSRQKPSTANLPRNDEPFFPNQVLGPPASQAPHTASRSRFRHALVLVLVIALGLASRRFPGLFPAVLGNSPGDALWALAVFLGLGILLPGWPTLRLGVFALVIAFGVEFSQLYRTDWLDAIRGTLPGRLVLGTTFVWWDLPAYTVGVLLGVAGERLAGKSRRRG